jgi:hypothetical protein
MFDPGPHVVLADFSLDDLTDEELRALRDFCDPDLYEMTHSE